MNTATLSTHDKRIHSIDILRGVIMVIMALDHTRDFFSSLSYDPLDLTQTTPQMFLTRWITHFCAPIFVFLAGTSAFLSLNKHGSKKTASLFLLKRGLWIIFLELVVINLSWTFDIHYMHLVAQVFWTIGWSMIFLAALIWLPIRWIAAIGLSMILFHNAFDGVAPENFGSAGWLWSMFHEGGFVAFGKTSGLFFAYPLIPWIGVMAVGYAFGTIYKKEAASRKKILLQIGLACIVLFIVLRWSNVYGNEGDWVTYEVWWKTVLSFINCTKYPPSFLYLLMTLGPGIIALAFLEKTNNKLSRFFTVYGKVPMFYYILHVPIIHGLAMIVAVFNGSNVSRFTQSLFFAAPDPTWGFSLPVIYMVWIFVVLLLYGPCLWFMKVKARRKDWWLSYL
ncbi:MAG: heparan-alpha-glucosaminide N-acetyltransferase domain-containing protein [Taibaiella sp.]|jgi:uncharacterized membrane protein